MNVFAPKAYADELPDGNTEDNQDLTDTVDEQDTDNLDEDNPDGNNPDGDNPNEDNPDGDILDEDNPNSSTMNNAYEIDSDTQTIDNDLGLAPTSLTEGSIVNNEYWGFNIPEGDTFTGQELADVNDTFFSIDSNGYLKIKPGYSADYVISQRPPKFTVDAGYSGDTKTYIVNYEDVIRVDTVLTPDTAKALYYGNFITSKNSVFMPEINAVYYVGIPTYESKKIKPILFSDYDAGGYYFCSNTPALSSLKNLSVTAYELATFNSDNYGITVCDVGWEWTSFPVKFGDKYLKESEISENGYDYSILEKEYSLEGLSLPSIKIDIPTLSASIKLCCTGDRNMSATYGSEDINKAFKNILNHDKLKSINIQAKGDTYVIFKVETLTGESYDGILTKNGVDVKPLDNWEASDYNIRDIKDVNFKIDNKLYMVKETTTASEFISEHEELKLKLDYKNNIVDSKNNVTLYRHKDDNENSTLQGDNLIKEGDEWYTYSFLNDKVFYIDEEEYHFSDDYKKWSDWMKSDYNTDSFITDYYSTYRDTVQSSWALYGVFNNTSKEKVLCDSSNIFVNTNSLAEMEIIPNEHYHFDDAHYFEVDGERFIIPDDMYYDGNTGEWSEWLASEYNTKGFKVDENKRLTTSDGKYLYIVSTVTGLQAHQGEYTFWSTYLRDDLTLTTTSPFTIEIGGKSYELPCTEGIPYSHSYMNGEASCTVKEWIDSVYNNGTFEFVDSGYSFLGGYVRLSGTQQFVREHTYSEYGVYSDTALTETDSIRFNNKENKYTYSLETYPITIGETEYYLCDEVESVEHWLNSDRNNDVFGIDGKTGYMIKKDTNEYVYSHEFGESYLTEENVLRAVDKKYYHRGEYTLQKTKTFKVDDISYTLPPFLRDNIDEWLASEYNNDKFEKSEYGVLKEKGSNRYVQEKTVFKHYLLTDEFSYINDGAEYILVEPSTITFYINDVQKEATDIDTWETWIDKNKEGAAKGLYYDKSPFKYITDETGENEMWYAFSSSSSSHRQVTKTANFIQDMHYYIDGLTPPKEPKTFYIDDEEHIFYVGEQVSDFIADTEGEKRNTEHKQASNYVDKDGNTISSSYTFTEADEGTHWWGVYNFQADDTQRTFYNTQTAQQWLNHNGYNWENWINKDGYLFGCKANGFLFDEHEQKVPVSSYTFTKAQEGVTWAVSNYFVFDGKYYPFKQGSQTITEWVQNKEYNLDGAFKLLNGYLVDSSNNIVVDDKGVDITTSYVFSDSSDEKTFTTRKATFNIESVSFSKDTYNFVKGDTVEKWISSKDNTKGYIVDGDYIVLQSDKSIYLANGVDKQGHYVPLKKTDVLEEGHTYTEQRFQITVEDYPMENTYEYEIGMSLSDWAKKHDLVIESEELYTSDGYPIVDKDEEPIPEKFVFNFDTQFETWHVLRGLMSDFEFYIDDETYYMSELIQEAEEWVSSDYNTDSFTFNDRNFMISKDGKYVIDEDSEYIKKSSDLVAGSEYHLTTVAPPTKFFVDFAPHTIPAGKETMPGFSVGISYDYTEPTTFGDWLKTKDNVDGLISYDGYILNKEKTGYLHYFDMHNYYQSDFVWVDIKMQENHKIYYEESYDMDPTRFYVDYDGSVYEFLDYDYGCLFTVGTSVEDWVASKDNKDGYALYNGYLVNKDGKYVKDTNDEYIEGSHILGVADIEAKWTTTHIFKVDGKPYVYELGTTFFEWTQSKYNTDEFSVGLNSVNTGDGKRFVNDVNPLTFIEDGKDYSTSEYKFYIDGKEYKFSFLMSIKNWVNDKTYNTDNFVIKDGYLQNEKGEKVKDDRDFYVEDDYVFTDTDYNKHWTTEHIPTPPPVIPTTHSFSIDSKSYTFDLGMTFSAWIASDKNTDGFTAGTKYVITKDNKGYVNDVNPLTEIVENKGYTTSEFKFSIESKEFKFFIGQTLKNWVDDNSYNTDGFMIKDDVLKNSKGENVKDEKGNDIKDSYVFSEDSNNATWTVDHTPIVHSFSIDGKTYTFDLGMTFNTWVKSDKNTDGFRAGTKYVITADKRGYVNDVDPSNLIVENKEYHTSEFKFSIDNKEFKFFVGQTLKDWVDDFSYNTDLFVIVEGVLKNGKGENVKDKDGNDIKEDYVFSEDSNKAEWTVEHTPVVPPRPVVHSFSIDGKKYNFDVDMTFEAWLKSSYNKDGYKAGKTLVLTADDKRFVDAVLLTTKITDGKSYTTREFKFSIDSKEFKFYVEQTIEQWVKDKSYNTDNFIIKDGVLQNDKGEKVKDENGKDITTDFVFDENSDSAKWTVEHTPVTPPSPPAPVVYTFYIDEKPYNCYENSTFESWINSGYNVDNFKAGTTYVISKDNRSYVSKENAAVSLSDRIVNGYHYDLSKFSFKIGDKTFYYEIGQTVEEWENDPELNPDGFKIIPDVVVKGVLVNDKDNNVKNDDGDIPADKVLDEDVNNEEWYIEYAIFIDDVKYLINGERERVSEWIVSEYNTDGFKIVIGEWLTSSDGYFVIDNRNLTVQSEDSFIAGARYTTTNTKLHFVIIDTESNEWHTYNFESNDNMGKWLNGSNNVDKYLTAENLVLTYDRSGFVRCIGLADYAINTEEILYNNAMYQIDRFNFSIADSEYGFYFLQPITDWVNDSKYNKDGYTFDDEGNLVDAFDNLVKDENGKTITKGFVFDMSMEGSKWHLETKPVKEPDLPPVETDPVEPTPIDPEPVEPTPVDPEPIDPTPVEPDPVEPTPDDPEPDLDYMIFKVIVPISFTVYQDGEVEIPSRYIKNETENAEVKVEQVSMNSADTWVIVSVEDSSTSSKLSNIRINGSTVEADGTVIMNDYMTRIIRQGNKKDLNMYADVDKIGVKGKGKLSIVFIVDVNKIDK